MKSRKVLVSIIIIIVLLVWSHIPFITECAKSSDILKTTVDNYMSRIATISADSQIGTTGQTSISIGGGIVGAFFAFIFSSCFGQNGTYVVMVILALFGFIMLFEVTLIDMLKKCFGIFKRKPKEKKKKEFNVDTLEYDDEDDLDNKKDDKIVISSVEELKNGNYKQFGKQMR